MADRVILEHDDDSSILRVTLFEIILLSLSDAGYLLEEMPSLCHILPRGKASSTRDDCISYDVQLRNDQTTTLSLPKRWRGALLL